MSNTDADENCSQEDMIMGYPFWCTNILCVIDKVHDYPLMSKCSQTNWWGGECIDRGGQYIDRGGQCIDRGGQCIDRGGKHCWLVQEAMPVTNTVNCK